MPNHYLISPIRVFALVLAVVFSVETGIMLALLAAPQSLRESYAIVILDSVALVIALCPALWLLIVRPLEALAIERGRLLSRALTIQEQERANLARELHDDLGQTQTAVLLGLRAITGAQTLEQAQQQAQVMQQIAAASIDATRRLARGLAPSVLRDFGLGQAVERVCEDIATASAIEIVRDLGAGEVRLDPAIEIAAYRVMQEAITNAAKHSGATRIRVQIELVGDRILLTVADNGRGMPDAHEGDSGHARGLGLVGMRERVQLLGGEFRVTSSPSKGTTLRATLPGRASRA